MRWQNQPGSQSHTHLSLNPSETLLGSSQFTSPDTSRETTGRVLVSPTQPALNRGLGTQQVFRKCRFHAVLGHLPSCCRTHVFWFLVRVTNKRKVQVRATQEWQEEWRKNGRGGGGFLSRNVCVYSHSPWRFWNILRSDFPTSFPPSLC